MYLAEYTGIGPAGRQAIYCPSPCAHTLYCADTPVPPGGRFFHGLASCWHSGVLGSHALLGVVATSISPNQPSTAATDVQFSCCQAGQYGPSRTQAPLAAAASGRAAGARRGAWLPSHTQPRTRPAPGESNSIPTCTHPTPKIGAGVW